MTACASKMKGLGNRDKTRLEGRRGKVLAGLFSSHDSSHFLFPRSLLAGTPWWTALALDDPYGSRHLRPARPPPFLVLLPLTRSTCTTSPVRGTGDISAAFSTSASTRTTRPSPLTTSPARPGRLRSPTVDSRHATPFPPLAPHRRTRTRVALALCISRRLPGVQVSLPLPSQWCSGARSTLRRSRDEAVKTGKGAVEGAACSHGLCER